MSLINLITTHALEQANSGNWNEVLNVLNTTTVTVRNPKQWTLGEIEQILGADAARIIASAIKNAATDDPLIESAFVAVSTSGIQLHTEQRQAMIATIGQTAGLSSEQIAAMQTLGIATKSVLEANGYSNMTAAGLQAAWDNHKKQLARKRWRDLSVRLEAMIDSGDLEAVSTISDSVAASLGV